jgi:hypothetical protein
VGSSCFSLELYLIALYDIAQLSDSIDLNPLHTRRPAPYLS